MGIVHEALGEVPDPVRVSAFVPVVHVHGAWLQELSFGCLLANLAGRATALDKAGHLNHTPFCFPDRTTCLCVSHQERLEAFSWRTGSRLVGD